MKANWVLRMYDSHGGYRSTPRMSCVLRGMHKKEAEAVAQSLKPHVHSGYFLEAVGKACVTVKESEHKHSDPFGLPVGEY